MKLQPDLVRDILLKVEKHPSTMPIINFTVEGWPTDEVNYAIAKLAEGGFIVAAITRVSAYEIDVARVRELTFAGHEFLDKIRHDNVWQEIKAKAKEQGGNLPFQILGTLGEAILKKQLGLP